MTCSLCAVPMVLPVRKEEFVADATSSIFNKKAADKLRSPDDLDKYVRVTNPSLLAAVAAVIALAAGLLVWGFFGANSTSVTSTGILHDGNVMCLLGADDAALVDIGDAANVDGVKMEVAGVASVPLSRDEVAAALGGGYAADALMSGEWAYLVHFKGGDVGEFSEGSPLPITITTQRVAPIEALLRG